MPPVIAAGMAAWQKLTLATSIASKRYEEKGQ